MRLGFLNYLYYLSHQYSHSVFVLLVDGTYFCLCQLYSHIYKILKVSSLYGSYLLLLAPFLPVLSASSSVFKEHGELCVNFLDIYSTNNANRVKRMQIPIYLAEISPPAYRATFPGVAYQLGNVRYTFFCLFFSLLM